MKVNCKRLPFQTGQERACTRITRLVGCHYAENGLIHRKMVVDCPIVITSIYTFQARPDQEWGIIGQVSILHSWHWVLYIVGNVRTLLVWTDELILNIGWVEWVMNGWIPLRQLWLLEHLQCKIKKGVRFISWKKIPLCVQYFAPLLILGKLWRQPTNEVSMQSFISPRFLGKFANKAARRILLEHSITPDKI